MIIVAIIALSLVVLTAILAVFGNGLPSFPNEVMQGFNYVMNYVRQGAGIVYAFTYAPVIKAMLGLTIAAVVVYEGYKLVMWVAKKIPMFGVDD